MTAATHRASASTLPDVVEENDEPGSPDTRRDDDPQALEEDEENPLPPAIEPRAKRSGAAEPGRDPDPSAARPRSTRRVSQADPDRPGPTPGALSVSEGRRAGPKGGGSSGPPPDRNRNLLPPPEAEERTYNPFPETKRPVTWSDLSAAWDVERRGPSEVEAIDYEPRAASVPSPRPPVGAIAERPRAAADVGPIESCRYDGQRRQLLDFSLPGLDGRPVSLSDFDSDFILLDFWGTWCRPCLTSVPHLVELRKQFGARSLAGVGVACEEGPALGQHAHVADVAKQLGINYTILVSSKDDSASPVQEALHIQAFPTMILIDRSGRVVWRDQGATTTTLARLDRILATSTKAAGSSAVRR